MNNINEQKDQDRVLKILAIAGFVGLLIIIAWLGIQLVRVLPNAFTSLASLADSVYNYEPVDLIVVSNKSTVNPDENFTLSWSIPKQKGSFAFSYACADGLAVDMRDLGNSIKNLACDTNYNIGSVGTLELIAQSERERFVDIAYTVDFIPTDATEPTGTQAGVVTVINPAISDNNDVAVVPDEETTEEVATTEETEEPAVTTPTSSSTPTTPTTPAPTPTKPVTPAPKPTYTQQYVYSIPTSDPKGFTDLNARHLGSGILDANNRFIATTIIDNDNRGAIQFEVKNVGTKTSNKWTYTAKLPNGTTYTSGSQTELKPNERAVITLGFTIETTGTKTNTVSVAVSSDNKLANNSFSTNIVVTE
jgi:hypothetical protein